MRLRKPLDSCAECCCVQSGGDSQGHYSQYAQVPDVEKGGGAAKKKAPVKKKANLPPKKKGGPPGRKSVQEESEVRCFFVVLALRLVVPCGGVGCAPRFTF